MLKRLTQPFFTPKTRTTQILVQEMLFADDSAVVAHSAGDIQSESRRTVTQFSLKINIKKTECNTQGEGPCSSNEEFKSHNERILEKQDHECGPFPPCVAWLQATMMMIRRGSLFVRS